MLFEHQGFKNRGVKLRLAYAIGLAEFFPQTEKERAALQRPIKINPDISWADVKEFLRHQTTEE